MSVIVLYITLVGLGLFYASLIGLTATPDKRFLFFNEMWLVSTAIKNPDRYVT